MQKKDGSVFELGDIVLFQTVENGFKSNIGMILKHKENGNYAILGVYRSAYKDVNPSWIVSIDDVQSVRNEIVAHYETKIVDLQNLIRKPTQKEKETEKSKKYDELKQQIITTAKNMIIYKDDCDFENKLKAIADMKREIFSIELKCASDIRKENGKIKWKIREEESVRDNLLKNISDEKIKFWIKFRMSKYMTLDFKNGSRIQTIENKKDANRSKRAEEQIVLQKQMIKRI